MQSAVLAASALLLIGFVLRARLRWLQLAFIPASVAGGLSGLLLVQLFRRLEVAAATEGTWWPSVVNWVAAECPETLRSWPGWLIAVVFAGLLLERPARLGRGGLKRVGAEGLVVWIIVLGQVAGGLLASWLIVRPLFPGLELPESFGLLIETGWAGGHGTAAAMGRVFESSLGWQEGHDLGIFMATVGLGWSVVSGIAWTNLAVRRGWTRAQLTEIATEGSLEKRDERPAIGRAVVRSEVLEPLVFPVLILASAFLIGQLLQWGVTGAGIELVGHLGSGLSVETQTKLQAAVGNLPLFLFTLLGGLVVRRGLDVAGCGDLVDGTSIRRLTGVAMEFLVVAAIASLRLEAVVALAGPLAVLLVVAMAWTAFCLLWIGRRLLPGDRWLELGLINYGMSTGTTATGLLLLRIVDKDLQSGAAEDYALAAPLSAPFIGGGILTLSMPLILLTVPLSVVAIVLCGLVVGLFLLGRQLNRTSVR